MTRFSSNPIYTINQQTIVMLLWKTERGICQQEIKQN